MKANLICLVLIISISVAFAQGDSVICIIPQPQKITISSGHFELNSSTKITADIDLHFCARQLKEYLDPATGFDLRIIQPGKFNNNIELKLDKNLSFLGEEGYKLDVTSKKIKIEAFGSIGIFWAIQTLRQLLPAGILRKAKSGKVNWFVPCVKIEDQPRFKWRGLMIDYSRTFWNKQVTERYIDALAYYKMNVLHMHLTDDQGWRIRIDKYPDLTEKASKFDTIFHEPAEMEGYYTKDDIREIVEYARQRNVEIIPEVEMPGHSYAVFSAYPEYSCSGNKTIIYPYLKWTNIQQEIFCAGNDKTFKFLENILSEIIELFPSQYIHIGGDEATMKLWRECPRCQQRMKEEGLKDEKELQSWFMKRIESYLNAHGKKLLGWEEICEGGLNKTATIIHWRSREAGIPLLAAKQGNQIIMSPDMHCYLDYPNDALPIERVYSFNPLPEDLQQYKESFLGVQANFWSHIARTVPDMDRQIFPRLIAISEVAWTEVRNKNWDSFDIRLKNHFKALDIMDIYYYTKTK